jgi:hypothetical protein
VRALHLENPVNGLKEERLVIKEKKQVLFNQRPAKLNKGGNAGC